MCKFGIVVNKSTYLPIPICMTSFVNSPLPVPIQKFWNADAWQEEGVGYEAKSHQRMAFVFVGQNKTQGYDAR